MVRYKGISQPPTESTPPSRLINRRHSFRPPVLPFLPCLEPSHTRKKEQKKSSGIAKRQTDSAQSKKKKPVGSFPPTVLGVIRPSRQIPRQMQDARCKESRETLRDQTTDTSKRRIKNQKEKERRGWGGGVVSKSVPSPTVSGRKPKQRRGTSR